MAKKIEKSWAYARVRYRKLRNRSEAKSYKEFDAAVLSLMKLPIVLTIPSYWISAAKRVRFSCRRCFGTGRYITMVENNIPKGPGGNCYRCAGMGTQDDADVLRNMTHDRLHVSINP